MGKPQKANKKGMNALAREFFRELKDSKSRFISIVIIVALGAMIFAGIKATSYDMKITTDEYYKNVNLMDMSVTSNYGMSEEDIEALKKLDGVYKVVPEYQSDFLLDSEKITVLRAHSYDDTDPQTLNKFQIVSGRMPQYSGECLVEDRRGENQPLIGKQIKLETGTNDKIDEYLKQESYTVVGTVSSPIYISLTRGATTIGTGSVDYYIFLPFSEFTMKAYASARISFNSTQNLIETFSDKYKNTLETEKNKIKALAKIREMERFSEITREAEDELADGEKTLAEEKVSGENKLLDAKKKIEDGEKEVTEGERDYLEGKNTFEKEMAKAEKTLADSKKKLASGQKQYDDGLSEYLAGKKLFDDKKAIAESEFKEADILISLNEKKLNEAKKQLEDSKKELDKGYAEWENLNALAISSGNPELIAQAKQMKIELDKGLGKYDAGILEYNAGVAQLNSSKAELEKGKKELAENELKLINSKALLDASKIDLERGKKELSKGEATLEKEKNEGLLKLKEAEEKLEDGKKELLDGKKEYDEGLAEFKEEIAKAEKELEDGKAKLADLDKVEWAYTLRTELADVSEFNSNADRIDKISAVFPVFFLLIAALVCLTTMTRMVESQRTQIGTLKAMGYSSISIISKYTLYGFFASLLGGILGVTIGYQVFPRIIYGAYTSLLYDLPPVKTKFHLLLAVLIVLVAVTAIVLVTIYSCYTTLRQMPSQLLRPPAPKAGKRILLERLTPVWNLFNFSWKVTLRNLFRYKKRMLMTLIGIAGCTGLMLAGFGLRDSISGIADMQFGRVMTYDFGAMIDVNHENYDEIENSVLKLEGVDDVMFNAITGGAALDGGKKIDFSFVVTKDAKKLNDFIKMEERIRGKSVEPTQSGVVVTEKLAKLLNLSKGDSIKLERNNKIVDAEVAGIMENYTFHYVFIYDSYFEKLFGESPSANQLMVNLEKDLKKDSTSLEDIAGEIMKIEGVQTVGISRNSSNMLVDQMASLNTVIFVLVFCAGVLAFIVMYNLTNINILEREREVATIKVLGFYDRETSSYIYRESILLSVIGSFIGFLFGFVLTHFVINSAEIDMMMFGRNIHFLSYVYSFALTLIFTFIVKLFINKRIQSIDMIEALKSVD